MTGYMLLLACASWPLSGGLRVSAIKIDPYLNIDAGTMSPFEHGEVFVLDDGGEVSEEGIRHARNQQPTVSYSQRLHLAHAGQATDCSSCVLNGAQPTGRPRPGQL